MVHFSCDVCGKDLSDESTSRYVVRIEVFPAHEPSALTDESLDADPLDEMDELLNDLEPEELENPEPASTHVCFDLCQKCRARFLRDPLSREALSMKLKFSTN